MKIRTALSLLLWTVLAAGCGGGSGGGGSSQAGSSGGGGGGGGSGGSGGGGGGGGGSGGGNAPPNEPASAAIVFPWDGSRATAPTIVVRGKASDPDGVSAVRVNGVPATVAAPQSSQSFAAFAAKPSPRLAAESPSVLLEEGEVEFVAEIELEQGENEIVVTVEDDEGESGAADSGTIVYTEVPSLFEIDAVGSRIVGLSWTLTPDGYVQRLVEHDLAALEQTVHRDLPGVSLGCLRAHTNEYLYLMLNGSADWELRGVDLTGGTDTLLVTLPEESLDPG